MTPEDELVHLRRLNRQLTALLESRGIDWQSALDPTCRAAPEPSTQLAGAKHLSNTVTTATNNLSTPQKIGLFRSLFRGRADVYPVRWENRASRSGYSPACHNEWKPAVCGKPVTKCSQCPSQSWKPVTDEVIYDHLAGKHMVGVYPMIGNDQCHFLAVDFDEGTWQADASAFRQSCEQLDIPCAIEISRSGNGAHAWIFFSEPVSARLARNLGAAIISYTCSGSGSHHRQLKLSSYDRMFPNQDTVPKATGAGAGLGNLIALPLQKHPRAQGHSVFVDHDFVPYPDQWAYLANIKPLTALTQVTDHANGLDTDEQIKNPAACSPQSMPLATSLAKHIDSLIHKAVGTSHPLDVGHFTLDAVDPDAPWQEPATALNATSDTDHSQPPRPITLVLSNLLYLPKADLSPQLTNRLIRIAAFQNPEYYKAQALRLPVWNKPRIIACAENFPNHIGLPRGCLDAVLDLLARHNIRGEIQDERQCGQAPRSTTESQSPEKRFRADTLEPTAMGTPAIEISPSMHDETKAQPVIAFRGTLRPEQSRAVKAMAAHDHGVLCAPTAFGKTVTAAAMIAQRGTNTLVLVHRTELLEQWKERLCSFLGLSEGDIGIIGGGKKTISKAEKANKAKNRQTKQSHVKAVSVSRTSQTDAEIDTLIDIAMVQSLVRQSSVNPMVQHYGHVIVDECHHVSAVSFEQILKSVKAKYVLGLTATPVRRDGLHPIIMMQCGPIRHRASRTSATALSMTVQAHDVDNPKAASDAENINPSADKVDMPIQAVFQALAQDTARTELIIDQTIKQFHCGRKVLLLTERADHLLSMQTQIQARLNETSSHANDAPVNCDQFVVLHGRLKRAERVSALERLQSLSAESPRILLATGKLIGEGFDHAPLDTLILAMPISWKGTLQQYVGRLHREHASKTDILVIDFIDRSHPSLARMWNKRQAGYKAMGYEVQRLNCRLGAIPITDRSSITQASAKPNQEDALKGSSKGQTKLNI